MDKVGAPRTSDHQKLADEFARSSKNPQKMMGRQKMETGDEITHLDLYQSGESL
jgi:hypothetical protein